MSKEAHAVKINILEKEYLVACTDDERDALEASARYLSDKMAEIRESGKVVGMDRIAVMAALNLAHEAINPDAGQGGGRLDSCGLRIKQLNTRIAEALGEYNQTELN